MRLIFILGFSIILSGCPGTVNQINRLPDSQSLDRPTPINHPGPLRHEPSGFTFPERYDNFQRVNAYRYDTVGLNEGFGYNDHRPDCLVVTTFYLYPTPKMTFIGARSDTVSSIEQEWLTNEVDRSEAFIKDYFAPKPPAVVVPVTTPVKGGTLQGSSLTFQKSGKISEFRFFVLNHKWFLKYRFTYPVSCQAEVGPRLDSLLRQLPWATTHQGGIS